MAGKPTNGAQAPFRSQELYEAVLARHAAHVENRKRKADLRKFRAALRDDEDFHTIFVECRNGRRLPREEWCESCEESYKMVERQEETSRRLRLATLKVDRIVKSILEHEGR